MRQYHEYISVRWKRWALWLCVVLLLVGITVLPAGPSAAQGIGSGTTQRHVTVTLHPYWVPDLPTVETGNATAVTFNTALLWGNLTSAPSVTVRGFVWDSLTWPEPGNTTAPADSDYANYWTEEGSYSEGEFSRQVSLSANTTYYVRAAAYNAAGWSYGDEETFATPEAPTVIYPPADFTITQTGVASANLTWTPGLNAPETYIRVKIGSPPADMTDGYLFYAGDGTWAVDSGLALEVTRYEYSAWGYSGNGTYSTAYATGSIGGEGMVEVAGSVGSLAGFVHLLILLAFGVCLVALSLRWGTPQVVVPTVVYLGAITPVVADYGMYYTLTAILLAVGLALMLLRNVFGGKGKKQSLM